MDKAGRIVEELLGEIKNNPHYREFLLKEKWSEIVGPLLARKSYVAKKDATTLYVYVENSVLMNELFVNKKKILRKIEEVMPNEKIEDIVFKAGRPRIQKRAEKEEKSLPPTELTAAEREAIIADTEKIPQENLRKAFLKLRLQQAEIQKSRRLAGWRPCRICGELTDAPDFICTGCVVAAAEARQRELMKYILREGIRDFAIVKSEIPCSEYEYEKAREFLIKLTFDRIYRRIETEAEQYLIVSLLLRIPLAEVSAAGCRKIVGKLNRMPLEE